VISHGIYPQETAQLESDAFVQRQKVMLAAEVKSVLDSWVRFEQQAKESEQAELAKSIIAKVLSTVRDEKTQREILNGAVAEVERKCQFWCTFWMPVY
jgi:F-type H+-transporting ATPase subunit b